MIGHALLAFAALVNPAAHELPTVKTQKLDPPKAVAEELAKSLSKEAFIVESGGKTLAVFWLRQRLPIAQAGSKHSYSVMKEGTFVGVVDIKTDEWTDFRKQLLDPGVYTLRYGLQPRDGNHMGVAPSLDFLCLCKPEKDDSIAPIEHKSLMNMSKVTLDTGHPVTLWLNGFEENLPEKLPSVVQNDLMHTVVQLSAEAETPDGKSHRFPLGIVVVGHTTAE